MGLGGPVEYRPGGGDGIPVDVEMQADEAFDAAVLRLAEAVAEWLPVAAAVEGTDWLVDSPPTGQRPVSHRDDQQVGLLIDEHARHGA